MTDLVIYAVDASIYDNLPFLNWDSNELLGLTDFRGKTVIDVGAGTGKLTFPPSNSGFPRLRMVPV